MNTINCAICGDELDLRGRKTIFIDHPCGHYSHARCIPDDDNDMDCAICKPESVAAQNRPKLDEPDLDGFGDWVMNPPAQPHINKATLTILKTKDKLKKDPLDCSSAYRLLELKTPIPWMIRFKKLGLGHLFVEQGITLTDFLNNGYSIDDLCTFKDIGHKGPERGLQTLVTLGLTPDMLIDYANLMPVKAMKERFGMTPSVIASERIGGGLYFHPEDGLRSKDRKDWNLDHMVHLGFRYKDLIKCGLCKREHWDDLKPTRENMKKLGVQKEEIESLPYEVEPIEEEESPKVETKLSPFVVAQINKNTLEQKNVRIKYSGLKKK